MPLVFIKLKIENMKGLQWALSYFLLFQGWLFWGSDILEIVGMSIPAKRNLREEILIFDNHYFH